MIKYSKFSRLCGVKRNFYKFIHVDKIGFTTSQSFLGRPNARADVGIGPYGGLWCKGTGAGFVSAPTVSLLRGVNVGAGAHTHPLLSPIPCAAYSRRR